LLELAKLLWLLDISCIYVLGLDPPVYNCVGGPEVDESIVLVRLPLMADRDIEGKAFGVSGGEKGVCSSCSTGGEAGVFGSGFSVLRVLVLLACFTCCGEREGSLAARSGVGAPERWPVCMSLCLCCPPEIDPNFFMPLRTPLKKSRSGDGMGRSSSLFESDGVENLDSSEPGGPVSWSAMIKHAEENRGEKSTIA
jgi:hypothetical protein